MARAHSFWMIVDGGTPTAFRGREREDLLPTLVQLQRTQPGVELVWFERGRTWPSREAARAALEIKRASPRTRNSQWRPGGNHVDPRAKYEISRDEKRARFKRRLIEHGKPRPTPEDTGGGDTPPARPPRPSYPARPDAKPAYAGRDRRPDDRRPDRGGRPDRAARPDRPPQSDRHARPDWKPKPQGERKTGFGDKPWRPKGPWRPKAPGAKPGGRPFGGTPSSGHREERSFGSGSKPKVGTGFGARRPGAQNRPFGKRFPPKGPRGPKR